MVSGDNVHTWGKERVIITHFLDAIRKTVAFNAPDNPVCEAGSIMIKLICTQDESEVHLFAQGGKASQWGRGLPELMPSAPHKPTPPSPGAAHQTDMQGREGAERVQERK